MKLKWVELRYRTKRGERRKVRAVDHGDAMSRLIAGLEKNGCYSFIIEEI